MAQIETKNGSAPLVSMLNIKTHLPFTGHIKLDTLNQVITITQVFLYPGLGWEPMLMYRHAAKNKHFGRLNWLPIFGFNVHNPAMDFFKRNRGIRTMQAKYILSIFRGLRNGMFTVDKLAIFGYRSK